MNLDVLCVMDYLPKSRFGVIRCRPHSTLLYIVQGEYVYTYEGGCFTAQRGDCIYIPKGAEYTFSIASAQTHSVQVEFDLTQVPGEEDICFHHLPQHIHPCPAEAAELFSVLRNTASKSTYLLFGDLYKLIFLLLEPKTEASSSLRRLRPALEHLQQNYTQRIPVALLAEMCTLSEPHFRRLFHEATGLSPVKYRNKLLMQHACQMLSTGVMNVGEVASALDFPDIYTFSTVFRRELSLSPKKWQESNSNIKSDH